MSDKEPTEMESLEDALEGMRDMFCYVDEYFRVKWDHQGFLDRFEAFVEAKRAKAAEVTP